MKIIRQMNKESKVELLINIVWTAFGILGGLDHYSKGDYLACGVLFLVGFLYSFKLFKSIIGNEKNTL
jgi:hypothetical protein